MGIRRLLTATALAAAVAACSDSSGPSTQGDIAVRDNSFSPSARTVDVGTTVTWAWDGGSPHNVTWVGGTPAASPTQTNGTYQRTFDAAGTYQYYCTIHGTPTSGMRGTVTVQ